MELPKISLDGMKSKLGLSSEDAGYERRSSRRNDYDDYDDYDDGYGYDDSANGYSASSEYEPYNQVTTRASGARRSTISSPRLVSATDVRASTRLSSTDRPATSSYSSSSYTRPSRSYSSGTSSFRTLIDNDGPAPSSPAEVNARKNQAESANSLFGDSSVPNASSAPLTGLAPRTTVTASTAMAGTGSSYDPFDSLSGTSTQIHTPTRSLEIIRPSEYNDVERVAKILRAGDVAIISLGLTPEDLCKRVLDFSFGVASALDATVDCVAPKVFAITTGSALSDAERMRLRSQGVI